MSTRIAIIIAIVAVGCQFGSEVSPQEQTQELAVALASAATEEAVPLAFKNALSPQPLFAPSSENEVPSSTAVDEAFIASDVAGQAEEVFLVDHPLEEPAVSYTLRRGESLAHFARWSSQPVEEIAQASSLSLDDTYPVGTEIRVTVQGEARSLLEHRRDQHHETRVEGYLSRRGGAIGTEFYTVSSGDSAWTIGHNELGLPVWLIEAFNPSADLEGLRPGQKLMFPVVADIVVDAGSPESSSE
jgi:LysM repeat protein